MPITFYPASNNEIKPYIRTGYPSADIIPYTSATMLTKAHSDGRKPKPVKEILQSTFGRDHESPLSHLIPHKNGFIDTVLQAYNQHHALVIRPDDIWLCILSQFSLYVNGEGRAEQLRHLFVAHEGKKKLTVEFTSGNRYTVDFGEFAQIMTKKIHENVVDPALREWILPNFSTTTPNDTVVGSVLMMASLKAYFEYHCMISCGIPKVTLMGTQEDWVKIYNRIDKLSLYGTETAAWSALLRPVIARFVKAFEPGYAESQENLDFWQRVIHYQPGGSGPSYICGWATAFAVFRGNGQWQGDRQLLEHYKDVDEASGFAKEQPATESPPHGQSVVHPFNYTYGQIHTKKDSWYGMHLQVDGMDYQPIDTGKIPASTADVEVKLNDNGEEFDTLMVAGLAGMSIGDTSTKEGMIIKEGELSPVPAWWMFIV